MSNNIPNTMTAVLLTGHGGLDKLDYRSDVPTPSPNANANANEVLIKVSAAGIIIPISILELPGIQNLLLLQLQLMKELQKVLMMRIIMTAHGQAQQSTSLVSKALMYAV